MARLRFVNENISLCLGVRSPFVWRYFMPENMSNE